MILQSRCNHYCALPVVYVNCLLAGLRDTGVFCDRYIKANLLLALAFFVFVFWGVWKWSRVFSKASNAQCWKRAPTAQHVYSVVSYRSTTFCSSSIVFCCRDACCLLSALPAAAAASPLSGQSRILERTHIKTWDGFIWLDWTHQATWMHVANSWPQQNCTRRVWAPSRSLRNERRQRCPNKHSNSK